ncbi:MAG: bifunctional heptose 7-phosphate kinase/heptose 1-phosphate adenyltransferase [Planctomycetales bacterium]
MSYHLVDCLQRIGSPRVLVVGDLILDRYIWGEAERVSQEAPVILLREERQEIRLGGAANVAHMLRGLEAEVSIAGAVGDDADSRLVRNQLEEAGCRCDCVITDPSRPTTVKERYLGRAQHRHPHQMLRVDREVRTPLAGAAAEQFLNAMLAEIPRHDAVLVSDYGKGVCTHEITQAAIRAARAAGIPVIADPASSGDYAKYTGATALTPNRLEAGRAAGRDIRTADDAFAAGRLLCAKLALDHIFVTLDSDGIALVRSNGAAEMLGTRRREVYDITGAGDMVLATIGVGAAAGIDPVDLARLANVAGGLEVEQIGVVTISREEILADLIHGTRGPADKACLLDELERHVAGRRKLGQRIVFTNGCFDLLHAGHVAYLNEAAREGDCLIVAVNSDASVRSLGKAPNRPLFDENHRATMLAALEAVDYVIVFDEPTPHALLDRLRPDLLVKGGTYSRDEIVGRELVEAYGGQVKPLGAVPGLSTTEILKRLRDQTSPATISHPSVRVRRKAG